MHRLLRCVLRQDFGSFLAKAFSTLNPGTQFLHGWHLDLMAEYLEAARRRELTRLIINVPPRSLKSVSVSVAWPAWLLGHDPAMRIMTASYAASLSLRHSLDCRHLIQAGWYRELFPGVKLMRDQNEKHKFMTTRHGFRYATSVGGAATGEGGDVLIIDDPLNPAQAASRTAREAANHWFDQTFSTRLNDKKRGVMVLVMQRLHADDLSGYLLARGGWEHLCIPAIAPQKHIYDFGRVRKTRESDELLQPEREDDAAIARARADLGSVAFAAQYQQNPLPAEGAMVQYAWLRRYDAVPESGQVVQSWDTAIKAGENHDASACVTLLEHEGAHYLLDVMTGKFEYPALKRCVLEQAARWQPQAILMEDAASGQSLLQDLRMEVSLPLIAMRPRGDKVMRLASASSMIEAGRLLLPQRASWLAEFERELLAFPAGTHDDQVDALTQYILWMRQKSLRQCAIRPL